MNDRPIHASAVHDGVAINVEAPASYTPFDLDAVEKNLKIARRRVSIALAEAKFIHDLRLFQAALYALGSTLTIADAFHDIEEHHEAELQAEALVRGHLVGQGWQPVTPVNGTRPVYRDGRGLLGAKIQVELGREHAGDVLVSLVTGQTLTTGGGDAYLFNWVTLDGQNVVPDPNLQWWKAHNYLNDLGRERNDRRYQARKDLRTPALPVDLPALLATIPD